MISTNDLRGGMAILMDGIVHQVLEAQHVKQARGAAFVRARLKNLESGATINRTFRAAEKVEQAILEKREMQYLYASGDDHYFMDTATYEQIPIKARTIGEGLRLLPENMVVQVLQHESRVIGVELPPAVEVRVVETEPGVRGDTVSGGSKPARVATGAVVQVPLFVDRDEVIRVDTRSGEYLGRG